MSRGTRLPFNFEARAKNQWERHARREGWIIKGAYGLL
jgi:hypothetical protein